MMYWMTVEGTVVAWRLVLEEDSAVQRVIELEVVGLEKWQFERHKTSDCAVADDCNGKQIMGCVVR